ncbi:MAG: hypothetical protein H7Y17_02845 [Chlorobia bacterium]|nr:hypothetical protein [Fimbriimonadaceae bacterium]
MLGPPAVAAVLAYMATFLFAPKYESYATYYFPLNVPTSGLAQLSGATPGDRGSMGGFNGALSSPLIGSAPQTAVGIFASRTCRDMVREDLRKQGRDVSDLTPKELASITDTKLDRSGMVRLEVVTEKPELSQAIVKAYQKAFEAIAQKLTLNVSQRNRLLLEERLEVLNARAKVLQRQALEAVAKPNAIDLELANSALWEAEKMRIETSQKRAEVEAKLKSLIVALGRIYDTNTKQPGINAAGVSPILTALEDRRLAFEDARRAFQPGSAEFELAEKNYLTASNLARDLAKDKKALASAGIDPQSIEAVSDYAGLLAAEKDLEKQIANLRRRAVHSAGDVTTIDGLKADLAQTRKTIAQLDSEYQLALIAEARDPSRFEVLDEPIVDPKSVFPRRLLIAGLAGALIFALIAGRIALRTIRRQEKEVA